MALTLDRDALLKTLGNAPEGMTALQLFQLWSPTWSLREVEAMLKELVQQDKVQTSGRACRQYQARPQYRGLQVSQL